MNDLVLWCAFIGAWLLFAGPVYQGVLELRELEIDREAIAQVADSATEPPAPSRWWWIFPPAMWILRQRRNTNIRHTAFLRLTPDQRKQFAGWKNMATGWFIVAAGAALIAVSATYELAEHNAWPNWVVAVLSLALIAGTVAVTTLSVQRTTAMLNENIN